MTKANKPAWLYFALLLLLVLLLAGCSGGGTAMRVLSVEAVPSETAPDLLVQAELHDDYVSSRKGETIYLFALTPGQTTTLEGLSPVGEEKISRKLTFRLPEVSESALYAGYVLADLREDGGYRMLTNPVYLTNPDALGRAEEEALADYPTSDSIKGLWLQDSEEAAYLRTAHTVITLSLGDYLAFSGDGDVIRYSFDGITFYLDRAAVEGLDRRVRTLTDAGVHPYLCILLEGTPNESMNGGLRAFYTDGAQPSADGYAISLRDRESFMRLAGFFSFLADRYTRADGAYGFAGSFILGECVNCSRTTYSGGARELSVHAAEYAALLRVADTALRSQFAQGRVYASFGGNYTARSADPDAAADPLLDYAARDMIDALAAHLRSGGDIPWNIALSLSASRKTNTRLWDDPLAEVTADAKYITPHNLSVISDYLASEILLWQGEPRRIVISDLHIASAPASDVALAEQAASYAYAYARVLENGHIEALIYRAAVDEPTDTLGCGLRSLHGGLPADYRPIYTNFCAIDRVGGTLVGTDQIGELWSTLTSVVSASAQVHLIEGSVVKPNSKTEACTVRTLFDFTRGDDGSFLPADHAAYLEMRQDPEGRTPVLCAVLHRAYSDAMMGVGRTGIAVDALHSAAYLSVEYFAEAPSEHAALTLRLSSASGETLIYESNTRIETNTWSVAYFDIGDYTEKLGSGEVTMHLWLQEDENSSIDGTYSLLLRGVDLLCRPNYTWVWILSGLVGAAVLLLVGRLTVRRTHRHLRFR